jgi:hypothetical protein
MLSFGSGEGRVRCGSDVECFESVSFHLPPIFATLTLSHPVNPSTYISTFPLFDRKVIVRMGALLSLPLLVLPSVGTVSAPTLDAFPAF